MESICIFILEMKDLWKLELENIIEQFYSTSTLKILDLVQQILEVLLL